MPETSSAHNLRVAIIGLVGALFLLIGPARTAHASGCHGTDRPILAHSFSWERTIQAEPSARRKMLQAAVPLSYAPRSCPGESPDFQKAPIRPFAFAEVGSCTLDPPAASHSTNPNLDTTHLPPPPERLERPPR